MEKLRNDIQWPLDYLRYIIGGEYLPHERKTLVNMCLYYGDFLAVQNLNRHITWCSYMNIGGMPISVPLIIGDHNYNQLTEVDTSDFTHRQLSLIGYLKDAYDEIDHIISSFGWDKAKEFVSSICNIIGQPKVTPEHMFYYAKIILDKVEKRAAQKEFDADKEQRISEYTVTFIDPEFEEERTVTGFKYTSR